MNSIGKGTTIVNCPVCGIEILKGLLISHMQSEECCKKSKDDEITSLRKRVEELERSK